jgi:spore coat protein SA
MNVGRLLKVAVITPGTFAIPSGSSSSVERVVEQVSQHLAGAAHLYIFGKKDAALPSRETDNHMTYIRFACANKLLYLQKISQSLHQIRPDIIQIENRPRMARYLRRKHPRTRIILSLHSVTFISKPHIGFMELRACLHCADRIVVNSLFLKQFLMAKVPHLGNRIEVNHLGVNPEQFISRWTERGALERTLQLENEGYRGKKIILFVGRLVSIKGVHHLLQVMSQIKEQEPDAVLVIVGSAFYGKDVLTDYVIKLHQMGAQIPAHVRFVSYVPYEEIQNWFLMADVVVVPSEKNEAFGLVNVEAMAAGIPVIATRAGGMKEIVEDGVTGYLIEEKRLESELQEKILELLHSPDRVQWMGINSMLRVQRCFTWKHTAERWMVLYRSMVR